MDIIVGTAGHIDHGKTALIKALTGIDADRLPEEKRRGITVDLGFAEMSVGDVHFGFVDVPGHERFVKNMLAGASGIDLVMLVIAADEGVMPQTREHFDICRLLGVRAGIVVLTKADLADDETLELAELDASELVAGSFLENAPKITVSARSGSGIAELKDNLVRIAQGLPTRTDQLIARLPIDRSFSVKGFGAVVTGTLASGTLTEGEEFELLPLKAKVRIRGIQTHGESVKNVSAGRRVAVNLGGIDHSRVERGMLLAEPGVLTPTQAMDAEVEVVAEAAKPLRSRQRIRLHIGTVEALARVQVLNEAGAIEPGERGFVQLRLEIPAAAIPGERFIIRRYSPPLTIAGGVVIDNSPVRHRKRDLAAVCDLLTVLRDAAKPEEMALILIAAAGTSGMSNLDLRSRTGWDNAVTVNAIRRPIAAGKVRDAGGRYLKAEVFDKLASSAEQAIAEFHKTEPLAKGISRAALRETAFAYVPDEIFQSVIAELAATERIVLDRESIRSSAYRIEFSPEEEVLRTRILSVFKDSGLEVPKFPELLAEVVSGSSFSVQDGRKFFQMFLDSGEIVKVSEEFYFYKPVIEQLVEQLKAFAAATSDRTIDMAKFKDLAGVSRKYAVPLLEYFDRERITVRRGDQRFII